MNLIPDYISDVEFEPYDDEYMVYDYTLRKYTLTQSALRNFLGLELGLGDIENNIYIKEQRDNVYRALLSSPFNPQHTDIVLFRIGKTIKGRSAIMNAMLSQVRYAWRHFRDMYEDTDAISPNAIEDLRQGNLWHKGSYTYGVNPLFKDIGY